MVRYSGLNARINNASTNGSHALIGDVLNFDVNGRGDTYSVPNIGNPYNTAIEMGTVRPELQIEYHPQNTSFLHNYLFVQTGNCLSSFHISYYANSADYGLLVDAKTANVEMRCNRNDPITVRATIYGLQWSSWTQTSTGSFLVSSTAPCNALSVSELKFKTAAADIIDLVSLWRRWRLSVNYRTEPIFTGTTILPTDVLEGIRDVEGEVEWSMTNVSNPRPFIQNASFGDVVIGIMNAPMSSCYTVQSAVLRTAVVRVAGTDVQVYRTEFHGKMLTRSSL